MATPGLYLLDGDLFVATSAPECFKPGCPGVRLNALRGHFLHKGSWKGSGTVDVELRNVTVASGQDVLKALVASAPEAVGAMVLEGPSGSLEAPEAVETVEDVMEGLREPISGDRVNAADLTEDTGLLG